MDLIQEVWQEGRVPINWLDSAIVPIPKKEDLALCYHWQGIALLDVGGMVLAKVIQARLQVVAEIEYQYLNVFFIREKDALTWSMQIGNS